MKLENTKIIFLGDSITQGALASKEENFFHQIIKSEHNLAQAYNCGIGGTRIAKQTNPSSHIYDLYYGLRIEILPKEADAIVVFGGSNDFGHGDAKLGDIDSTDVCTFYGALNCLIADLQKNYPNAKIIFMTPLKRSNESQPNCNGYVLEQYVDAIIKFTQKNNLPVIDLFRCGLFDPNDSDIFPDGLHPNDIGHKMMADYIAQELLKI